jgi:LacI family transcriptional regulator
MSYGDHGPHSEYPFPFVNIDDRLAAYQATRYLIDNGHREIGLICDTTEPSVTRTSRLYGYLQALEQSGIPRKTEYITCGDSSYQSGLQAAEDLLEQAPGLTAVFAVSDEMALAVITVANRKGLRVPDDLSVMGCDNTLMAEMSVPPLTTVSQPLYRMGFLAGEILFQMIRKERKPVGRLVEHTIVERSTVRKYAALSAAAVNA